MDKEIIVQIPAAEEVALMSTAHMGAMTPGPVDERQLATPMKFASTLIVGIAVGWVLGAYSKK